MYKRIWGRAFSRLFLGLSIGWFGAVFVLPGLSGQFLWVNLTANIICGILSLIAHVLVEGKIQKWDQKK